MAITGVQNVTNIMADEILFINTESSGNNRYIEPKQTQSVGNAWVPWCGDRDSFPYHHMELVDTATGKVFAYIWQHGTSDGDFVRISPNGYEDQGAHLVKAGATCNFFVDSDGTVSASDA